MHDYSDENNGFILWKNLLEEQLTQPNAFDSKFSFFQSHKTQQKCKRATKPMLNQGPTNGTKIKGYAYNIKRIEKSPQ